MKIKKAIRVTGKVILVIICTAIVFLTGLCVVHQSKLKKERAMIKHIAGQYAEVDGHNINVYTEGDGEKTLVFLAGFGTPSPVFDFKPLYSKLTSRYRIAVIEKFGYGYSDEYEGDRSLDTVVRQNREALKVSGIEGPYILVPHSAGGIEAIWWADHYPEEVEAIIGLDSNVPEQYDVYRTPVDFDTAVPKDVDECIASMAGYDFLNYTIGLIRFMPMPPAASSDALTSDEKEQYTALGYVMYCKGASATFQRETIMTDKALKDMREYHDGPIPDVPTLFFVSDGSVMKQIMDPGDWVKIHENYISQVNKGELVCLDCGHYVHAEKSDEVAASMISFIEGLSEETK